VIKREQIVMTDATTIEAAPEQVGAITPMLVTVGPMTTVCLLHNTLVAAARRRGVPDGKI
jgi:5,10-methylene-tetrahydrofolate dehydrogenase/methenyl tetrahydrofolate cyclohydrolase